MEGDATEDIAQSCWSHRLLRFHQRLSDLKLSLGNLWKGFVRGARDAATRPSPTSRKVGADGEEDLHLTSEHNAEIFSHVASRRREKS